MKKEQLQEINEQISEIWDRNIFVRAKDIADGTDYSYTKVIMPFVIDEIHHTTTSESSILDIGCGCGYLTNAVFEQNRPKITGIDLSKASIQYSIKQYPHIEFIHQDIYTMPTHRHFDLCLAVMTLNNLPDINSFFTIVNKLISSMGKLIIIIPHPCFWPFRHLNTKVFVYDEIKCYKTPFQTKGRQDYSMPILYFHRPIDVYVNAIIEAGFKITRFKELAELSDEITPPDIIGLVVEKMS